MQNSTKSKKYGCLYSVINIITIISFLWSNLVWAGFSQSFKLSAPSQATALVPLADAFAAGQQVVKQLAEDGIGTKEEFYSKLDEELEKGKIAYLAGVPCLVFSDQDDPLKLAYYVFSPSEPYFSRITTYSEVNDSLWNFLKLIGIDKRSFAEVREFEEKGKRYYQQIFTTVSNEEEKFIDILLEKVGFNRSILNQDLEEFDIEKQVSYFELKRSIVEESGLDAEAVERIKKHFEPVGGELKPDKIVFQPTGIVLRTTALTSEFKNIQRNVAEFFGEERLNPPEGCIFYQPKPEEMHVSIVSYGHYAAEKTGAPEDYMPDEDIKIAKQVIAEFGPLHIRFKGLQIMPDGCVIVKGFVDNDDIFRLRRQLITRIPETGKSVKVIIHVNFGRLLDPNISREKIKEFHNLFGEIPIGEQTFLSAVSHDGQFLTFGESCYEWHKGEDREKPFVISIDFGSTNFRIGVMKPDGTLIPGSVIRLPSPNYERYPHATIDELQSLLVKEILDRVDEVRRLYPTLNLKNAGISIAGPVDSHGKVLSASSLWGTKSRPYELKEELLRHFPDINWRILNDVAAAAYRYGLMEENKYSRRLAIFTVSTGLGGKVFDIDKGEVFLDEHGLGGEPGHVKYNFAEDAPLCDCGVSGHLGAFAPGGASLRNTITWAKGELKELYEVSSIFGLTGGNPESITNQMIAREANEDDSFALEILDRATLPLAVTIKNYVRYFGVDKVVIMGGFAMSIGTLYMDSLKGVLHQIGIPGLGREQIDKLVVFAEPGDDHGLIGAGRYVQEESARSFYGLKAVMDTKGDSEFEVSAKRDIVHRLIATSGVFDKNNGTIAEYCGRRQILLCLDEKLNPEVETQVRDYFSSQYRGDKVHYLSIGKDGIDSLLTICRQAKTWEMDRHCIFVAVGDRANMNITGLAAQFFRRGGDYMYIPTDSVELAETELAPEPVINYRDVKLGSFYPPSVTIMEYRELPEIRKKFDMVSKYRKYRFLGVVRIDSDSTGFEIIDSKCARILSKSIEEFDWRKVIEESTGQNEMVLDQATRPLAVTISEQALAIGIEKFIITGTFAQREGNAICDSIRRNLRQMGVFGLTDTRIDELVESGDEDTERLILWLTSSEGDFKAITDDLGNEGYEFRAPANVRYNVVEIKDLFSQDNGVMADYCRRKPVFICVDENVYKLYRDKIRAYFSRYRPDCEIISVPFGEENKNMEAVLEICSKAKKAGLDSSGMFVVIGGGVAMDIVGLAAAIYEGGIDYIRVPTTLLGIVDAGVGIKTGVNFEGGKNFLGSFYPPLIAVNDESFLNTLDERMLRCGIAEMIKMAIVIDRRLFELIESFYQDILDKRLSEEARFSIKLSIWDILKEIQQNFFEKETHKRLPDFGHPLCHIFESLSNYELAHGEAVGIDMVMTSYIAYRRGICPGEDFFRILSLLKNIGLPVYHPLCSQTDEIMKRLRDATAHRGGSLNMTIPTGIGKATFTQELNASELREAAEFLKAVSSIKRIPFHKFCSLDRDYPALVVDKDHNVSIETQPIPYCGPKDMILTVLYAGICGTDIKIVKGERDSKPGVIGHECIAMVVHAGEDVKGFRKGDLVALNPNDPAVFHNIIGHDRPGVFSQIFLASEDHVTKGQVVKIPAGLRSPLQAIFIEPVAVVAHSLAPVRKDLEGKTVAVVGAGQMGRLHAMLAKAYGAKKVILINRSLPNLEFARKRGIVLEDDCLVFSESTKERVLEETNGRGVDLVMLCTTFAITYLKEATDFVSNNGKILVFGGSREGDVVEFPGGPVDCHNIRLNNSRNTLDVGNGKIVEFIGRRGALRSDFMEAINLLSTDQVQTQLLVSYVVSLESLPSVLSAMATGEGDAYMGKVIVDMRLEDKVILPVEEWDMLLSGGIDKKKIAIMGITGDLGPQLANCLLEKGYKVTASVRPQSIERFCRRIGDNRGGINIVQGDIFSVGHLKEIISQNSAICQMADLVGLDFEEKDYALVLAANGFAQGLITALVKRAKREGNIRFIYSSSQRVRLIMDREEVREWVGKAVGCFNEVLEDIINSDSPEKEILGFIADFIEKNPIPDKLNIYELSKLIGEYFVNDLENSVIVRISDLYGPGYGVNRTIPRIVKTIVTGGERREEERIVSPLFVNDINEILYRIIGIDEMHLGHYGTIDLSTGLELTKQQLIDRIEELGMPLGSVVIDDSPVQPVASPTTEGVDITMAQELLGRPFTPFEEESLRQLMSYLMEDEAMIIPSLFPPYSIVFDIGGTTTRVGIFTPTGEILEEVERFETPTFKTHPGMNVVDLQELLLDQIVEYIQKLQKNYPGLDLSSIAICFAGTVKDDGIIGKAASLWGGVEDYPLKQKLEGKLLGVNFFIANDVVAASWRYGLLPKYRDRRNICVLTVSSGIGYKMFNVGRPDISDNNVVSLGHIRIDTSPEALQCDCGESGHLAAYSSGRAAERRLRIKAVNNLEGFKDSSIYEMARAKIGTMTFERRKELLEDRVTKDILRSLPEQTRENVVRILSQEVIVSEKLEELYKIKEVKIARAIILENNELCEAINNNDPFALSFLEEITLPLARELIRVAASGVEKIVIMGGFALAIKDNFLNCLIKHMKSFGLYGKSDEYFEELFDWAEDDDNDGLIGAGSMVHYIYSSGEGTAGKRIKESLEFSRLIELRDYIIARVRENRGCNKRKLSLEEESLLKKAFIMAYIAHNLLPGEPQLRDDGKWFLYHPLEVAKYLVENLEVDDAVLAAATFIHDVVEHTPITAEQLEFYFGREILNIVLDLGQEAQIQHMNIPQLKERGFDVQEIAKSLNIDDIEDPEAVARIARIAMKFEHLDRLMKNPLDKRSRLLKVIDNIVNYSSVDRLPLASIKRREPMELLAFRAFSDAVEMPDKLRKDINIYIDKLLAVFPGDSFMPFDNNVCKEQIFIAVSLAYKDIEEVLDEELVERGLNIQNAGADAIHFDVKEKEGLERLDIAGQDNTGIYNHKLIKKLREAGVHIPIEVHLMYWQPKEEYIRKLKKAGLGLADTIFIHHNAFNSKDELAAVLKLIRNLGVKSGVALSIQYNIEELDDEILKNTDAVLLTAVEEGVKGGEFNPIVNEKVKKLFGRRELSGKQYNGKVYIQGGITDKTIGIAGSESAGAFVSGTFVFKSSDMKTAIEKLREIAAETREEIMIRLIRAVMQKYSEVPDEVRGFLDEIRENAENPDRVNEIVKNKLEPHLSAFKEVGTLTKKDLLARINIRLVPLGYLIRDFGEEGVGIRNPSTGDVEMLGLILYSSEIRGFRVIDGRFYASIQVRQITDTYGKPLGNEGWEVVGTPYTTVFLDLIERVVDKRIIPLVRDGKFFYEDYDLEAYSNYPEAAKEILTHGTEQLVKEFKGKSRQEIIDLIMKEVETHEYAHREEMSMKRPDIGTEAYVVLKALFEGHATFYSLKALICSIGFFGGDSSVFMEIGNILGYPLEKFVINHPAFLEWLKNSGLLNLSREELRKLARKVLEEGINYIPKPERKTKTTPDRSVASTDIQKDEKSEEIDKLSFAELIGVLDKIFQDPGIKRDVIEIQFRGPNENLKTIKDYISQNNEPFELDENGRERLLSILQKCDAGERGADNAIFEINDEFKTSFNRQEFLALLVYFIEANPIEKVQELREKGKKKKVRFSRDGLTLAPQDFIVQNVQSELAIQIGDVQQAQAIAKEIVERLSPNEIENVLFSLEDSYRDDVGVFICVWLVDNDFVKDKEKRYFAKIAGKNVQKQEELFSQAQSSGTNITICYGPHLHRLDFDLVKEDLETAVASARENGRSIIFIKEVGGMTIDGLRESGAFDEFKVMPDHIFLDKVLKSPNGLDRLKAYWSYNNECIERDLEEISRGSMSSSKTAITEILARYRTLVFEFMVKLKPNAVSEDISFHAWMKSLQQEDAFHKAIYYFGQGDYEEYISWAVRSVHYLAQNQYLRERRLPNQIASEALANPGADIIMVIGHGHYGLHEKIKDSGFKNVYYNENVTSILKDRFAQLANRIANDKEVSDEEIQEICAFEYLKVFLYGFLDERDDLDSPQAEQIVWGILGRLNTSDIKEFIEKVAQWASERVNRQTFVNLVMEWLIDKGAMKAENARFFNIPLSEDGLIIRGDVGNLFRELIKQKDLLTDLRPELDREDLVGKLRNVLAQKRAKIGDEGTIRKIQQAIADLEIFDIKEFNAIVLDSDKPKSKRKWLLGFNSLAPLMAEYLRKLFPNPTLGYAREAIDNLKGYALLEYLLHEPLCRYVGHYEARKIQEILFADTNYMDAEGEAGRKKGIVNKLLSGIISILIIPPLSVIEPERVSKLKKEDREHFLINILAYQEAGADGLHFDVRERVYLKKLGEMGIRSDRPSNTSLLNPQFIQKMRKRGIALPVDVHLLYYKPSEEYLASYKGLGVRSILVQYNGFDSKDELIDTLKTIRSFSMQSGVVIELDEPVSLLNEDILREADIVVFSSVRTTGIGREYTPIQDKITELRQRDYKGEVLIQGGVNQDNIGELVFAGATSFVVGTHLVKSSNMKKAIRGLKERAVAGIVSVQEVMPESVIEIRRKVEKDLKTLSQKESYKKIVLREARAILSMEGRITGKNYELDGSIIILYEEKVRESLNKLMDNPKSIEMMNEYRQNLRAYRVLSEALEIVSDDEEVDIELSDADTRMRKYPDELDPPHRSRYEFIRDRILTGEEEVLDLGCGTGYGSDILADNAKNVIAMDFEESAVECAMRYFQKDNLEYRVGNAMETGLPDSCVDMVVCVEVLEHLYDKEGLFEEIRRVLKPGGRAIITAPLYPYGKGNPTHIVEFDRESFGNLLNRHFCLKEMYGQARIGKDRIKIDSLEELDDPYSYERFVFIALVENDELDREVRQGPVGKAIQVGQEYMEFWQAEVAGSVLGEWEPLRDAGQVSQERIQGVNGVLDRLVKEYGLGILAIVDVVRIVDNIPSSVNVVPYGMMVKEEGDNVLLLDVDAFVNERLLYIVLEHELKESLMSIIPCENDGVRELTANFMSLKLVLEKGISIDKAQLEDLGADLQFFKALEVLQAMKQVSDNDIIAVAIEYMRRMPYYSELFKKFPFSSDWRKAMDGIVDAEARYEAAIMVFNEIMDARLGIDKAKEEVDINIKAINTFTGRMRIIGLEGLSRRLQEMIGAMAKQIYSTDRIAGQLTRATDKKYILVHSEDRLKEFIGVIGEDEYKRMVEALSKNNYEVCTDEAQIPKGASIIRLVDPADLEDVPKVKDILYLPMPYTRSSFYMAANILQAEGDVNRIDPLVIGIIKGLYCELDDNDLVVLFTQPWEILPKIKGVLDNINELRIAVSQIEKAA